MKTNKINKAEFLGVLGVQSIRLMKFAFIKQIRRYHAVAVEVPNKRGEIVKVLNFCLDNPKDLDGTVKLNNGQTFKDYFAAWNYCLKELIKGHLLE